MIIISNDDIFYEILRACSLSTLLNLCAVSTHFYAAALPHLVRDICFRQGPFRLLGFLRFIIDKTRIVDAVEVDDSDPTFRFSGPGKYVMTLEIWYSAFRTSEDVMRGGRLVHVWPQHEPYPVDVWAPVLTKALSLMPNLRSVTVYGYVEKICGQSRDFASTLLGRPLLTSVVLREIGPLASSLLGEAAALNESTLNLKRITLRDIYNLRDIDEPPVLEENSGLGRLIYYSREHLTELALDECDFGELCRVRAAGQPIFPKVTTATLNRCKFDPGIFASFPSLHFLRLERVLNGNAEDELSLLLPPLLNGLPLKYISITYQGHPRTSMTPDPDLDAFLAEDVIALNYANRVETLELIDVYKDKYANYANPDAEDLWLFWRVLRTDGLSDGPQSVRLESLEEKEGVQMRNWYYKMMQKKKTKGVASSSSPPEDDLFSGAEDDFFANVDASPTKPAQPTELSSASSEQPTSKPSSVKSKAKTAKLSPEERSKRFEALHAYVAPQLGKNPEVPNPRVKKRALVTLMHLAQSEAELGKVVELLPRWREAGKEILPYFAETFVRRCQELACPNLALSTFGNFAKYQLTLTLPAAQWLLHALCTSAPLEQVMVATSLYPIYGLPPISGDLASATLVAAKCYREGGDKGIKLAEELRPSVERLLKEQKRLRDALVPKEKEEPAKTTEAKKEKKSPRLDKLASLNALTNQGEKREARKKLKWVAFALHSLNKAHKKRTGSVYVDPELIPTDLKLRVVSSLFAASTKPTPAAFAKGVPEGAVSQKAQAETRV
ncbi:hypothetical protein CVT26_011576 [Gymnopilus dilepis]|uniref:F-box domain-containing protein n=1 Tax=Gymnopilus dilepis TaxID=231916 RepID=A0A409YQN1_9AGAR|nr:hypothetical protein CVT26_011576 [Gymnopilus dilepis]